MQRRYRRGRGQELDMAEQYEPSQAHGGRFETDEDYEPINRGGRTRSANRGRGQNTSRNKIAHGH